MLSSVVNLSCWLMLNALVPESLPPAVVEQYGDRLVVWTGGGQRAEIHLFNALKNLRYISNVMVM